MSKYDSHMSKVEADPPVRLVRLNLITLFCWLQPWVNTQDYNRSQHQEGIMNYQLEIGTMSKKIEWSRCSTYKTRTQQDYISILIQCNLYKWGLGTANILILPYSPVIISSKKANSTRFDCMEMNITFQISPLIEFPLWSIPLTGIFLPPTQQNLTNHVIHGMDMLWWILTVFVIIVSVLW